jgi:hypothetical protein
VHGRLRVVRREHAAPAVVEYMALRGPREGLKLMEKPNDGYTSKQLARVLPFAISPDEINYLARRNKIPAEKRGKMWVYKKKDLNKILKTLQHLNA